MRKIMRKKYVVGAVLAIMVLFSACAEKDRAQTAATKDTFNTLASPETSDISDPQRYQGILENPVACGQKNAYATLNVATYITRIDGTYFIADCYHDQIIYHDNLTDPLQEWSVLTREVHYAHTIASDGTVIVIDDTENNRLMVFQKRGEEYVHTQTLENIGMRPHYIQYDEKNQVFMAWSSITGEMYLVKRASSPGEDGIYPLYVDRILKLDALYGVYVRSFTVIGDDIYFVSGHNNQKIIKAVVNSAGDGFDVVREYSVADELAGMVQLSRIGGYYYITVSTDNQENQDYATIIRTDSLEGLADSQYEDIYKAFGVSGGTPYYITEIEGRYYMAHHRTSENIIAFDVIDDNIENVTVIY